MNKKLLLKDVQVMNSTKADAKICLSDVDAIHEPKRPEVKDEKKSIKLNLNKGGSVPPNNGRLYGLYI